MKRPPEQTCSLAGVHPLPSLSRKALLAPTLHILTAVPFGALTHRLPSATAECVRLCDWRRVATAGQTSAARSRRIIRCLFALPKTPAPEKCRLKQIDCLTTYWKPQNGQVSTISSFEFERHSSLPAVFAILQSKQDAPRRQSKPPPSSVTLC